MNVYGDGDYTLSKSIEYNANEKAYFLAATTSYKSNGQNDGLLIKTDSTGKLIWEKYFGDKGSDEFSCIKKSADNNYFICGTYMNPTNVDYDIWVLKVDSNGNILWDKKMEFANWDFARSLVATSDSGCIIVGETNSIENQSDVLFVKFDKDGVEEWQKVNFKYGEDKVRLIRPYIGNRYLISYTLNESTDSAKTYVSIVNGAAQELRKFNFGTVQGDIVNGVDYQSNGNIIIAGALYNKNYNRLIKHLIITDSLFNVLIIDSGSVAKGEAVYKDVKCLSNDNIIKVEETKQIGWNMYGTYDIRFEASSSMNDFITGPVYGLYYDDVPEEMYVVNDTIIALTGSSENFGPAYNHAFLLTMKPIDGRTSLTKEVYIAGVKSVQFDRLLTCNFVHESLIVNLNLTNACFQIINQLGQVFELPQERLSIQSVAINCNSLSNGIYYLNINSNNQNQVIKFVVSK